MDYDTTQQALQTGAYYATQPLRQEDWRPMATAPRDGTPIEVRCTYGVAPWFGLYRWIKTPNTWFIPSDGRSSVQQDGRWAKVGDDNSSFDDNDTFSWRPYKGDITKYIDPTHGAQDTTAYWRGAAAAKVGLPPDYFERDARRSGETRSWWGRWLDWLTGGE